MVAIVDPQAPAGHAGPLGLSFGAAQVSHLEPAPKKGASPGPHWAARQAARVECAPNAHSASLTPPHRLGKCTPNGSPVPAGGLGGAASLPQCPPTARPRLRRGVVETRGLHSWAGAGAKRRRSEAHAEPGELT